MSDQIAESGYAPVNGLNIYYQKAGSGGTPLIALHGAFCTVENLQSLTSMLSASRTVVSIEWQGHGRTNDVPDRPIDYDLLADDIAGVLEHLGVKSADFFGFSMGAAIALNLTLRHPTLVRKLIVASVSSSTSGVHPEILAGMETISPEVFKGTPLEKAWFEVNPQPTQENWAMLIEKVKANSRKKQDWDISGITAPTFIIIADSDCIKVEHAVEMFKILGGGVVGDYAGLPKARLAVLPGTTHYGMMSKGELMGAMVDEFLKYEPEAKTTPPSA